jgi:hypothetical protein
MLDFAHHRGQSTMPFPPETKEQIYSNICAVGIRQGFIVAPEFKLYYRRQDGPQRAKWADIVWISTRDHLEWWHNLPQYKVVAAFEVDGFDVPLPTIEFYSDVYPRIRQLCESQFSCYVPLYSKATHRPDYGLDALHVRNEVAARQSRANQHGNHVMVYDGANPNWLELAGAAAQTLAQM